jgi:hypothetical protein
VALDPDLPRFYITWSRHETFAGRFQTIVQQRESGTLSLLAEGELPSLGIPAGLVVAPRVAAPSALAAVVTGRTVRMSWLPSQDAARRTGCRLEAGSASGVADIAVFDLPASESEFVVSDVPAGTYYVRVRTVNGAGAGDSAISRFTRGSRKLCAGEKYARVRSSSLCSSAISRRLAPSSAALSTRPAPRRVERSLFDESSRAHRGSARDRSRAPPRL